MLSVAWWFRAEHYVSAGAGLGYGLGIAGLAMMTVLLAYSARKRLGFMARLGAVRPWFHAHMALGLLGPTAILLHSNFQLGSINSTISLSCMLLVAASGIVGRVIYTRIHEGLTGRRRTLRELQREMEVTRKAVEEGGLAPDLAKRLSELERFATEEPHGVLASIWRFATVGSKVRSTKRTLRRSARGRGPGHGIARDTMARYLAALRGAARFSAYERTFALWHAIHLPLCFLLFASAGVHVFAVHSY